MKQKINIKLIVQILIIAILTGYFSFNIVQSTFAANTKSPNVVITINNDGSISQEGSLFGHGLLYPSTVESAEKGVGGIVGILRIQNNYKPKIEIKNIGIGLNKDKLIIDNGYPNGIVYKSLINNVRLKVEKGHLFSFEKTIIDYSSLKQFLYDPNDNNHNGYIISPKDRFNIIKGKSVDLKYTLHMLLETEEELEGIIASIPIYINVHELMISGEDEDHGNSDKDGNDEHEVVSIDEPIPEARLNKKDHIGYIQGYKDNMVRPEGLITREETAAVFYRLLDSEYKWSILTLDANFKDVGSNRWSIKHIATLINGNIISGYPDGTFKPARFITRAELATIASKFDRLSPSTSNLFTDIDNHWAKKYINSAALKGWVSGYSDGTFKPDQYITRAEFVTLVNNVLERKVGKENILPDSKSFPDLPDNMWYYEAMMEAINSHTYIRLEDDYEQWIDIYYPNLDL